MRKTKKALKRAQEKIEPQTLILAHKKEFLAGVIGFGGVLGILIYLILNANLQPLKISPPETKISPTPSVVPTQNKYHLLKEGESLWEVAEKEYGNPYLYPTIIELNRINSPDFTNPGTKIRVR